MVAFIPLILMSVLAFWKDNPALFLATTGIAIMTGLYSPNIINGLYTTTTIGIGIGLTLIAYSLICGAFALRLMLWQKEG